MRNKLLIAISLFVFVQAINGQMDLPPNGGNPRATISEEVGITSITIKYSRPDVNGREGKIYGEASSFPVSYGFTTVNLNTNKNTQKVNSK